MLKQFFAKNYKNLTFDSALQFNNINILIGSNNSGKSNLIDALTFLLSLLDAGLEQSLVKNNFRSLLNRFSENPELEFRWTFNTESGYSDLTYELGILMPEYNYHTDSIIEYEKLKYTKPSREQTEPFKWISCHDKFPGKCSFPLKQYGRTKSLIVDANNKESVFNQLDDLFKRKDFTQFVYPIFYDTVEAVNKYFKRWKKYNLSAISTINIKSYSRLRGEETFINDECTNFSNVARVIFSKYSGFDIKYTSALNDFLEPNLHLDKVSYDIIGDKDVGLYVVMNGQRFDLHELSDGTVRLLMLVLILTSPEKTKVLFLDEPELNLHPAWIRKLSNLIRHASLETQIFLSTHSPELLDPLTDSFMQDSAGVYVFSRDAHVSSLKITEELKSFIQDGWALGDLYRVGEPVIGGWPW